MGSYHKLQDIKLGPLRICHKVSPNAYVLDLPEHLNISPTFNVADIYECFPPYESPITFEHSGEPCFEEGQMMQILSNHI